MLVQAILDTKPQAGTLTVKTSTSVSEAANVLSSRRIGALVVSDDGIMPLGILSERDIVRELGRRGTECLDDAVGELMTSEPITCAPADTVNKVMADMTNGRFRHMPVVEGDKMVGLISIGDVVKARMDELAYETEALQGMIMGR